MNLTPDLGDALYPTAFGVAFLLSLYFTPIVRKAAFRYGVLDHPDGALKKHGEPIPYLGGVSIYLAFLFALAFTYSFTAQVMGILLAASIVVTIGLFDDLKVLGPGVKVLGQLTAVFVLIKAGIMIDLKFLPLSVNVALTVFWMVGVTNAINLIDVSDGLAAGVASIAGIFLYVIALWNNATTIAMLTLALVGATLGFLRYNRPPARIYMGDTGSMFLGFMLAALAMIGQYTAQQPSQHPIAALAPIVILGVPIFDTLFVMGARLMRGLPLFRGSPDHFAVRLRRHGRSPARIALLAYTVSGLLGLAGLAICSLDFQSVVIVISAVAAAGLAVTAWLWRIGRGGATEAEQPPETP